MFYSKDQFDLENPPGFQVEVIETQYSPFKETYRLLIKITLPTILEENGKYSIHPLYVSEAAFAEGFETTPESFYAWKPDVTNKTVSILVERFIYNSDNLKNETKEKVQEIVNDIQAIVEFNRKAVSDL